MDESLIRTRDKIAELLSQDSGYFGRIYTWGQRPTEYEGVGYVLSEPIDETLTNMSIEQRKKLVKILFYFEIHARPLKKLLDIEPGKSSDLFSDIAWSHFMTVVMFGMLETAVRDTEFALYKGPYLRKGESIGRFLEANLPEKTKSSITERYHIEEGTAPLIEKNFSGVIRHLWEEIRSGFVHEGSIESKGLEWHAIRGLGTEENPISFNPDVPMQEWLQITWQAILHSFGYKGLLELPRYERPKKSFRTLE